MVKVVGVRFKKAGKIYYFAPGETGIKIDDYAIVETARGLEFGQVVVGPKNMRKESLKDILPIKSVVRIATKEDMDKNRENKLKEEDALSICDRKIEEHKLKMNLVDVEYTFDNSKVIFYFTADGRVDFRDLVKDLASIFRTRIELRQIGVRDEAKMIGGIGPCGISLCCNTFLGEFDPVSIKMAKDQNLSLNPTKISGLCGRLMCCLRYEHSDYEESISKLPAVGKKVQTPRGRGVVIDTNPLLEIVKVKLRIDEDTEEVIPFVLDEIN